MELKDNFTNRYFNSVKNYRDLVVEPDGSEAVAEGFSNLGKQPARSQAQRTSNALMTGIGSGIKSSSDSIKKEKLSPLLEQAGQINAQAAYLEAQQQDTEQRKMQLTKLFQDSSSDVMNFSQANIAGDQDALVKISNSLLDRYRQTFGDKTIGMVDHVNNGSIYYKNLDTGNIDNINIGNLLAQSGIPPESMFGNEAPSVMSGISPTYNEQIQINKNQEQLNRDMGQAKLDDTRAHTGLLNSQSGKMQHEMNAEKPKYNDKVLNNIMKQNTEWVNEMRTENRSMNQAAQAYENIAKHISNEVGDVNGRAGSGAIATLQRALNKAGTESEKNQVLIQYEQLPLLQDLKRIFGARITNADLEQFMKSVPTLDKNPQASIQVANERASEIRRNLKQDELTLEVLENDFGYGEPYNSLAVRKRVDALMNNEKPQTPNAQIQQTNSVLMQAPDGSQREVPVEQVQAWQQKGAVLVSE